MESEKLHAGARPLADYRYESLTSREHYEAMISTVQNIQKLVAAGFIDVHSPAFTKFIDFIDAWRQQLDT